MECLTVTRSTEPRCPTIAGNADVTLCAHASYRYEGSIIMSLASKMLNQLRNPTGWLGRWNLRGMYTGGIPN